MGNRTTFVATLAALALPLGAARGEGQPGGLDAAREQLAAGHAEQALALVDPIVTSALAGAAKDKSAICPGAAAAFLQAYMEGKFKVTVQDDWCEAMLVKGYALNELKRPADAVQVLETLVGHAPQDPHYIAEYAYAVRVNGDTRRSLELYQRAETAASQLSDRASKAHWRAAALRGQGYAYVELGRWDDATRAYRQSLKYEPGNSVATNELRFVEENRPR